MSGVVLRCSNCGTTSVGKTPDVDRRGRPPLTRVEKMARRASPEKREARFEKRREDRFDEPSEALREAPVLRPSTWPDVLRSLARTRRNPSAWLSPTFFRPHSGQGVAWGGGCC